MFFGFSTVRVIENIGTKLDYYRFIDRFIRTSSDDMRGRLLLPYYHLDNLDIINFVVLIMVVKNYIFTLCDPFRVSAYARPRRT